MHFERAVGDALELHATLPPGATSSRSRPASEPPAPEREQLLRGWLRDYTSYVARVLHSAGTPAQELDDAVQRTFIIAARRYADVRAGSERGFLLKTALHVAAHARRSAARRREVPTAELPEAADLATPELLLGARREQRLVVRLLERLVPELRTVLLLYEVEKLTMAEIAATLSIPAGTVASRLRRARQELRQRWRDARTATATLAAALVLHTTRVKALVGALTLGLVALAVVPRLRPAQTRALAATGARLSSTPVLATAPSVSAPKTSAAALEVANDAPVMAVPASGPTRRVVPSSVASSLPKASTAQALRLELQQLDRARALLASGQAAAALGVLDGYERSTPRGALKLEAEALRIDALGRSGRVAEARARASAFVAKNPSSVLAARVRQLAAR